MTDAVAATRTRAAYLSPDTNRRLAEKLFAHLRNGTTDQFDETYEYDLAIYADPAVAARERERIFRRLPMMALHSSQLPAPGAFATVELNETNALVTRGRDGRVRAFRNACRHRGAVLTTETHGERNRFSCPYHGWTYTNEGALIGVSFGETTGLAPCAERNLIALPAEERHGFIWIVEDPQGSLDVATHLAGMDEILRDFGLDTHHCYREHVFEFAQNWKIMMDGLIDGYHVHFVHGATIRPYFHLNLMCRIDDTGDHTTSVTPRRKIDAIVETEKPGQSSLDDYVVYGNMLMPNVSVQLHPHHVEFWTMYQNTADPGRCRAHLRFLTPQRDYDERGTRTIEKNWDIAVAAMVKEDVPVGDGIQRNAAAPGAGKAVLGRNEVINQAFHRAYDRYMAP